MPSVKKSALVAHSAQAMFDLVNDVDRYHEFLPGCADSRIEQVDGNQVLASMLLAKAGIRQWMTTRNQLNRPGSITMTLHDGPFQSLSGEWRFHAMSEKACQVELQLSFEFTNALVEMAFGRIFKALAGAMVDAFIKRARSIYG